MTEVTRTSLHELTAVEAANLIRRREISPVDLVQHLLDRAAAVDPPIHAWETLDAEGALLAAREAEVALSDESLRARALVGVPFGAKDIFDTAGLRTAAGFAPYAGRVPKQDAEVVQRLKSAGAILLGKMVTTQFAYADPSPTRNPWSALRTPGGSSSGSAAGVSAREVPFALGSQTAGSTLRPAAYNGVVGFKPGYGRISKRGVLPLAWSLDHVGLLARSVADCALVLGVAAGHDPPTAGADTEFDLDPDPPPPRLGLVWDGVERATPHIRQHVLDLARDFEAAGARVTELRFSDHLGTILGVHQVIMQTEAAAVHWQSLEQHPGAYGPRLRAYVEVGRLLPAAVYVHALRLRRRIRADMARMLTDVDALVLPTATDVAPTRETTGDPSLQAPFSLVGFPSISLFSGLFEPDQPGQTDQPDRPGVRLPLAVQLVAGAWEERRLLNVARWCESRLPELPSPPLAA